MRVSSTRPTPRAATCCKSALVSAGFAIEHSEGSLYLWATRSEHCWTTVANLADLGILVAPGAFYGPAGRHHVRVAFTTTDERVDAAVARLARGHALAVLDVRLRSHRARTYSRTGS